jgi:hypothetical protein
LARRRRGIQSLGPWDPAKACLIDIGVAEELGFTADTAGDFRMDATRVYLRRAFLSWEIMRVPYSLVALGIVLRPLLRNTHADYRDWLALGLFPVLLFNILHCLGPLAECLLFVLFGLRLGRLRYAVSPAGLLAVVLVYKYFWPTLAFLFLPIAGWLQ